MLFDTHCHIYDEAYEQDLDEVIKESSTCKVKKFLVPGNTLEECKKAVKLANEYENIYCAVGIHPSEVFELNLDDTLNVLEELLKEDKLVAFGEIGLDYYWHKKEEEKELQRKWFKAQIALANRYKLPIIIHSREACLDTITILKETNKGSKVVFHCFSYSVEVMEEIVKLGWYIGLDGPVTFKNAVHPKEVAKRVPLNKLLLETDCPYLTPHPYRGKRNNPKYLTYIAMAVAQEKGLPYDEVCEATYKNGCDFFGVDYE